MKTGSFSNENWLFVRNEKGCIVKDMSTLSGLDLDSMRASGSFAVLGNLLHSFGDISIAKLLPKDANQRVQTSIKHCVLVHVLMNKKCFNKQGQQSGSNLAYIHS